MNARHGFLAGWAITIGTITYFDIKDCHDLPWPPRFIASAIVFGMIDLFATVNAELAGIIAIGIVLAALVNKGFTSDCTHTNATVQTSQFDSLQGQGGTYA